MTRYRLLPEFTLVTRAAPARRVRSGGVRGSRPGPVLPRAGRIAPGGEGGLPILSRARGLSRLRDRPCREKRGVLGGKSEREWRGLRRAERLVQELRPVRQSSKSAVMGSRSLTGSSSPSSDRISRTIAFWLLGLLRCVHRRQEENGEDNAGQGDAS